MGDGHGEKTSERSNRTGRSRETEVSEPDQERVAEQCMRAFCRSDIEAEDRGGSREWERDGARARTPESTASTGGYQGPSVIVPS